MKKLFYLFLLLSACAGFSQGRPVTFSYPVKFSGTTEKAIDSLYGFGSDGVMGWITKSDLLAGAGSTLQDVVNASESVGSMRTEATINNPFALNSMNNVNVKGSMGIGAAGVHLQGQAGGVVIDGHTNGITLNGGSRIIYNAPNGLFQAQTQDYFRVSLKNEIEGQTGYGRFQVGMSGSPFDGELRVSQNFTFQALNNMALLAGNFSLVSNENVALSGDNINLNAAGEVKAPVQTIEKIDDNVDGKILITKEYLKAQDSFQQITSAVVDLVANAHNNLLVYIGTTPATWTLPDPAASDAGTKLRIHNAAGTDTTNHITVTGNMVAAISDTPASIVVNDDRGILDLINTGTAWRIIFQF